MFHQTQEQFDQVHKIQDVNITSSNNHVMDSATLQTGTNKSTHRIVSAYYDEPMPGCPTPAPVTPCPDDESASSDKSVSEQQYTNIEDKYLVDRRVLGSGHHGSVRQCMDRKTGQRLAVKSIRKSDPAVKPGCLQREIMLLEEMKHSNIIRLVDVFEDDEYLHLVTDLCKGGELFDKIVDKASSGNGCFSEHQAAQILHQILTAVSYLHKRNIVHRDIKPENILFETTAEDSPIKVIDFGLARKHYANKGEPNMTTVVGTPYYIAPEVLRKNYGKACDLWSIGVIAYVLLCGYPPFNGNNNAEVYESVRRGIYWFPSEDWKNVSSGAKDFISRLLQKDPRNRMTVDQALRHPWLIGKLCSENPTTDEKIDSSVEVVYDESFKIDSVLCGGVLNHRMDVC